MILVPIHKKNSMIILYIPLLLKIQAFFLSRPRFKNINIVNQTVLKSSCTKTNTVGSTCTLAAGTAWRFKSKYFL